MVNRSRDGIWDAELDDPVPSTKTKWNGHAVEVSARLIPRYLWTTASINVFIDGRCILRTGGQFKAVGSSSAEFDDDGSVHSVRLAWDQAIFHRFPYRLSIDGTEVSEALVPVDNYPMLLIPLLALASPFVLPPLVLILIDHLF
jgi:hypothetical protein